MANADRRPGRRDRALVLLAGVVPDLDGLGAPVEMLTVKTGHPLLWFSEYHHALGHNLGAALLTAGLVAAVARRRLETALLALLMFHLHLLGDIVGGRGPDGYDWPIPYLLPFSEAWQLSWRYQWELNAWPNFVITGVLLAVTLYLAWRRGFGPLEILSTRADATFVSALRTRFGVPAAPLR